MATRGLIGFFKDGIFTASYNHYDSYESSLGKALNTFFNTPERVEDIASMGDIRFVDPDTGEIETFPNSKPRTKLNVSRLDPDDASEEIARLADSWGADYLYIFNGDKWEVVRNRGIRSMLDPIKDILYSDYENEDDRMNQDDIGLEESIINQFKYRAGIIK